MVKNRRHDIVKPSKFKTSVCSFYLGAEGCPFGDQCAFAHGLDELRCERENAKKVPAEERVADFKTGDAGTRCSAVDDLTLPFKSDSPDCVVYGLSIPPPLFESVASQNIKQLPLESGTSLMKAAATVKEDFIPKESVTLTDGTGRKGVKPPPKMTRGKCVEPERKDTVNSKTKSREIINNNNKNSTRFKSTQRRVAHQYIGMDVNGTGLVEGANASLTVPCFAPLPPRTVLIPYSSCVPSFVTHGSASLSVPSGDSQMTCFGGAAGITPFATPTTNNDSSLHHSSYGGVSMPFFHNQGATVSGSDHHHYHHPTSQPSFVSLMSSSMQPTVVQIPITDTPLSRNFIWSHHPDRVVPQTDPNSEEMDNATENENHCKIEDLVASSAETYDERQCVMAEWNAAIEKWLKYQKDNVQAEAEGETRCTPKDACSLSVGRCSCSKCVSSSSLSVSSTEGLKIITEVDFKSECEKKAMECNESVPSGLKEWKETSSAESGTAICSKKTSFGVCYTLEGKTPNEDAISTCGKHITTTPTSERNSSPPKPTCDECRRCIPNDVRKRRPVMANRFHSTCRAACQSIFLYCAEKNTILQIVNNEVGEKDDKSSVKGVCSEAYSLENAEYCYDYCI